MIEPRWDTPGSQLLSEPIVLTPDTHIAQITPLVEPSVTQPTNYMTGLSIRKILLPDKDVHKKVQIDPHDLLPTEATVAFQKVIAQYKSIFDERQHVYNDAFGIFLSVVNMAPSPLHRERVEYPSTLRTNYKNYRPCATDGVLAKPDSLDVTVEYLPRHS